MTGLFSRGLFSRSGWGRVMGPLIRWLVKHGVTANTVTVIGTLGAMAGALAFYSRGVFFVGTLIIWAFAMLDFVVDLRVGSPTFGQVETVLLDAVDRRAVYLTEGLGHAFCALEDDTTAMYLCTAAYNPTGEHGIHPLDPELGLDIPRDVTANVSPKDQAAPTLAEALDSGLLPTYAAWQDLVAGR